LLHSDLMDCIVWWFGDLAIDCQIEITK